MSFTRNFKELNKDDADIAGGKGASLGEMTQAGIPVPPGFVVLSTSFDYFLKEKGFVAEIDSILDSVNHNDAHSIEQASERIQGLILNTEVPEDIRKEINASFEALGLEYVAVRSSATAEDGVDHAWAGQLNSYLNTTKEDVLEKVKHCWASLFTPRAIFYRFEKGLHKTNISIAVVIQKMIQSETSGIAFSVHPVTKDPNQLIIEAGYGLGEAIVSGAITPDSYIVEKDSKNIIDISVNVQTKALYRGIQGGVVWEEISEPQASSQVLANEQILELSNLVINIENHYGFPCDIEWAYEKGKFYITQSRPITTLNLTEKESVCRDKEQKWVKDRFFNGLLIEESLVLLLRNKFFLQELGTTYHNTITVKGVGDFLLELEEKKMTEAKKKRISPRFDFILKVNILEEKIRIAVDDESKRTVEDYYSIFELMSEHLAYYGLAKEEAELIYKDKNSSQKDRSYIEKWRNDKTRWNPHDKLWEKISNQISIPLDIVCVMQINELVRILKGELVDMEPIKKRVGSVWSVVERDGQVAIYLEDMSPIITSEGSVEIVKGQTGYSNGEIVTGIVGKDILVVKKTHPDMINEISRVKVVITDEGGILSHAAITCRELKKLCIIGTSNATEVLKDGDMVEVDAEKGVIKILKQDTLLKLVHEE